MDLKGMDLAEAYYRQYGEPMLREQFPELADKVAAGLIGSGSECLGFDDELSQNHDFEPGFCIFIGGEDDVDSRTAFALERAYAKLPDEFMGSRRARVSPVGGSRHGVIRLEDFFMSKLGSRTGVLEMRDWLRIPEYSIREVTNGKIFYDGKGTITKVREDLDSMPEDVRLKKIAGHLLIMGQAGQYNFVRCCRRNDEGAAQLAVFEFVQSAMHVIYSLNGELMPYYKWAFRGMRGLKVLSGTEEALITLLTTPNGGSMKDRKAEIIENVCGQITGELQVQGVTCASCGDLEQHAYSVNDHIRDNELRNMNILAAV